LVTFPFSSTIKHTKTCPSTPSSIAFPGYRVDLVMKDCKSPGNVGFISTKSKGALSGSRPEDPPFPILSMLFSPTNPVPVIF
jgi:hypothetical protein